MTHLTRYILKTFLVLICTLWSMPSMAMDYGLRFHSHAYATEQRTTLFLDDGERINIRDQFSMAFTMDLRPGEAFFGNIFCIKTNDGHHIDAILSMPQEGVTKPALVVDKRIHYVNYRVTGAKNTPVEISLNTAEGQITYSFGGHRTTIPAPISHSSSATIIFGKHPDDYNYVDVAPMDVCDINIKYDNRTKHLWDLRQHDHDMTTDNISGAKARAVNAHWILDDHQEWKVVYAQKMRGNVQIAYSQKEKVFYIVDGNSVRVLNPLTKAIKTIKVNGGHRAMEYSNFLGYNDAGQYLYTYNLRRRLVARFDMGTGRWSNDTPITDEPEHINHTVAMASDTAVFLFGGYGYYRYHNSLWRLNPATGDMRQIDYSPKIAPRTGAASVVVGDNLYIFGGYGNETGKQELPGQYYYDLVCINLKTHRAKTLWTAQGPQEDTSFQLAAEMIYDPDEHAFYAATTNRSGRLIKLSMKEPGWKVITKDLQGELGFMELMFDMYQDAEHGKLYVVVNRRMNKLDHEISIQSIDLPLQDDDLLAAAESQQKGLSPWAIVIPLLVILVLVVGFLFFIRRRKRQAAGTEEANAIDDADSEEEMTDDALLQPEKAAATAYYAPKAGYISMLGKFQVIDSKGDDITMQFTKRTRNLLLLLLLYSENHDSGIDMHLLDETLWQDMDEDAARKNRNVYMRKLRLLLEQVGDIEIQNDKLRYTVRMGDNVFFDYHEALRLIGLINEGDDDRETSDRLLELLLQGPLLPTMSFEWLDGFKGEYSNAVLSLLSRKLRRLIATDDNTALALAGIMLQHDPFSDQALAAQCAILCRHQKRGLAKSVYDKFCRNYKECMGEDYAITFAEACK